VEWRGERGIPWTNRSKHLSSRFYIITKENQGEGIFDVNSKQL
jgi:hypothetical protein